MKRYVYVFRVFFSISSTRSEMLMIYEVTFSVSQGDVGAIGPKVLLILALWAIIIS